MWYWHGMGQWGWPMMVTFCVVVIVGIVWAVRAAPAPGQRGPDSALRILDERLARGEVDREEYEERRRILESHR